MSNGRERHWPSCHQAAGATVVTVHLGGAIRQNPVDKLGILMPIVAYSYRAVRDTDLRLRDHLSTAKGSLSPTRSSFPGPEYGGCCINPPSSAEPLQGRLRRSHPVAVPGQPLVTFGQIAVYPAYVAGRNHGFHRVARAMQALTAQHCPTSEVQQGIRTREPYSP
jgi:hypothetical protein